MSANGAAVLEGLRCPKEDAMALRECLAFLAGVGLLAASGAPLTLAADGPDQRAAAKGKIIYGRYCASCHGVSGRGDGVLAADLKVPPADLTQLTARNGGIFPFAAVARAIDGRQSTRAHGAPDMPVWGEIFKSTKGTDAPSVESAVGRLTHYIWTIQGEPAR
jgi:mono/diheme cytochrome c family protein